MSTPAIGDALRGLLSETRHARTVMSQADRSLAAATLVGIAVVLAWPKDKPAPQLIRKVGQLGAHTTRSTSNIHPKGK